MFLCLFCVALVIWLLFDGVLLLVVLFVFAGWFSFVVCVISCFVLFKVYCSG